MAITATVNYQKQATGELRSYGSLNPGIYVAGGVPALPNKFKLGAGDFDLQVFPAAGFIFEHDKPNAKLKAYEQGITTGATTAADSVSGSLALDDTGAEGLVRAMGALISTTYKLGALKEVTNGIDLSAVVARFVATGAF